MKRYNIKVFDLDSLLNMGFNQTQFGGINYKGGKTLLNSADIGNTYLKVYKQRCISSSWLALCEHKYCDQKDTGAFCKVLVPEICCESVEEVSNVV